MDTFKAPKIPSIGATPSSSSSSLKRKASGDLEAIRDDKGKQRATVSVSDVGEEDDGYDQNSYAPGNDPDYFAEEDEDGRFFGGGLSSTQKDILDIFEGDGGEDGEDGKGQPALTIQSVRRQLLNLERAINKNAEMRVKWAGQPEKFVESEVNLDTSIRELLLLTQNPRQYYPEMIKLGVVNSLADLLSHENVDISLAVISVLEELTDDDVVEAEDEDGSDEEADEAESSTTAARGSVARLANALLSVQLAELAVNNLARLNEEQEEQERQGVYHTLSLLENLLSLQPTLSDDLAKKTKLVEWLLVRLQPPSVSVKGKDAAAKLEDASMAQNRQYSAELLSILLQDTESGRQARMQFGARSGIEIALKVLSQYRKRDPLGAEEIEYMENIFDTLCSALSEPANKDLFLEDEGIELMVIIAKEKSGNPLARARSIKVLDYALSTEAGTASCLKFVDVLGLKTLFSAFMEGFRSAKPEAKGNGNKKKVTSLTHEDEEHILAILMHLLTNLETESVERIRVLKKFVENDYEKVDRLLEIRSNLVSRVSRREKELTAESEMLASEGLELDDVDIYLRRLEAGLYPLQMTDYILSFLCMEDDGIRDHARILLERNGASFASVVKVLIEYRENVGGDVEDDQVETEKGPAAVNGEEPVRASGEGVKMRSILGHLVEYLKGC